MTIYRVTFETYYDDFGGGGTYVNDDSTKYFASFEKANAYFDLLKMRVCNREIPDLKKHHMDVADYTFKSDGFFAICDDSSMVYWGSAARIESIEVEL